MRQTWDAATANCRNALSSAASAGGCTFDVLSLVLGGKGIDKVAKLARAGRAAEGAVAADRAAGIADAVPGAASAGAPGGPATGDVAAYVSRNDLGQVQYVGITSRFAERAAEHFAEKGIAIKAIEGLTNLSREDARAVEQVLIELYGLQKNGGSLLNKINSIARSNPVYAQSITRGRELLQQIGYPSQ